MIIGLSSEISVMSEIADKTGRDKKVVYINTASNGQSGDKAWLENQVNAIENEYWEADRYSIEWKTLNDFQSDLENYDIIHIWWGNTAYLLFHILDTRFDVYLREIKNTKIIIGSSAGAIILWISIEHVQALDDFSVVPINEFMGLHFFSFDIWVHFWKEKYREKYNEILDRAYKNSQSWIYISDNSYIISTDAGIEICNV